MSENTRAFLENINEYYMDEQHIDVSKEVNLVLFYQLPIPLEVLLKPRSIKM